MLELCYQQHRRQQQQHLWAAESITIREQQQNQMGRTQEIIAHLKAEQENKRSSPLQRQRSHQSAAAPNGRSTTNKHASFRSLSSASRLGFLFDFEESYAEGIQSKPLHVRIRS
jgi:hypothetical protein